MKMPESDAADDKQQQPIKISEVPPITVRTGPSDIIYLVFSGLLVLVGVLQVWLLCRTTVFVRRQAHEAKRQRVTMGAQLTVMRGQLTKMEESLKVTQDSVGFAKRNLEVFINEKRARIFVELKPLDLDSAPIIANRYMVKYTATCHGQTFAFVDDNRTEVKVTDSAEPPELPRLVLGRIDFPKAIPPETVPKEGSLIIWDDIDAFILASISHGKSFVHCRGIVKYKDFVGEERETAFCYRWKPRAAYPGLEAVTGKRAAPQRLTGKHNDNPSAAIQIKTLPFVGKAPTSDEGRIGTVWILFQALDPAKENIYVRTTEP